jgi:hypothetical protein
VVLGQREYKTEPANVDGGKTAPWNSDFALYGPLCNYEINSGFWFCVGLLSVIVELLLCHGLNLAVRSFFYDCSEFFPSFWQPCDEFARQADCCHLQQ